MADAIHEIDSDEQLERVAGMLRRAAYNAWSATLVGSAPQIVHDMNARMRAYKVGDLVMETTTVHGMRHSPASELDGIGHLEEITRERIRADDPDFWNEEEDGPWPTEQIHYIRTFDGRRFRWENASFIRVLDIIKPFGADCPPLRAKSGA